MDQALVYVIEILNRQSNRREYEGSVWW